MKKQKDEIDLLLAAFPAASAKRLAKAKMIQDAHKAKKRARELNMQQSIYSLLIPILFTNQSPFKT